MHLTNKNNIDDRTEAGLENQNIKDGDIQEEFEIKFID